MKIQTIKRKETKTMKVENIKSNNGNKIANQFVITDDHKNIYFQSYNSMIVKKDTLYNQIFLDQKYWNYSNTTGKYRKQQRKQNSKSIYNY